MFRILFVQLIWSCKLLLSIFWLISKKIEYGICKGGKLEMQRGKKVWTTSAAKTVTDTDFYLHTMLVYWICDKNQAQEKNRNKKYFMKEHFKIFGSFCYFFGIFSPFGRFISYLAKKLIFKPFFSISKCEYIKNCLLQLNMHLNFSIWLKKKT